MNVLGIGWLATKTDAFDAMATFVGDVLGLPATRREGGAASFQLASGDMFEVFAPDESGGGHPERGPIAGFRVEDASLAYRELRAAGYELSPLYDDESFVWMYVRAPDGYFYELFSDSNAPNEIEA